MRVDAQSKEVTLPLPREFSSANLNTATFDPKGILWFTGQNGVYGRLDPANRQGRGVEGAERSRPLRHHDHAVRRRLVRVARRRSSRQGRYRRPGETTDRRAAAPGRRPAPGLVRFQGHPVGQPLARRAKSDVTIRPRKPGRPGRCNDAKHGSYSVYVDDKDKVWLTDFSTNAIVRFDPATEKFESFPSDRKAASVRQMLGRPGEAWGAESGTDRLVVVRD